MRLIDADNLEELCGIMAEKCGGSGESIWNQFRATVEFSPTIDAVEVVRCKDCINWQTDWMPSTIFYGHYCPDVDTFTKENFYCAYAESRKL